MFNSIIKMITREIPTLIILAGHLAVCWHFIKKILLSLRTWLPVTNELKQKNKLLDNNPYKKIITSATLGFSVLLFALCTSIFFAPAASFCYFLLSFISFIILFDECNKSPEETVAWILLIKDSIAPDYFDTIYEIYYQRAHPID